MMVAPNLFDDVDGRYRGMDGNVHTPQKGAHNYSMFFAVGCVSGVASDVYVASSGASAGLCELPYSHGGGNGKAMSGLSVEDAQLMQGGTLVFHLKNQPISSTQLLLSRFV